MGFSIRRWMTGGLSMAAFFCVLMAMGAADAETLMTLDDFEGKVGAWRGAQIVTEPVHGGTHALRWEVSKKPTFDSPRFAADWTDFDELRFWAFSDKNRNFKIPVVFPAAGGYYMVDWYVNWEGWKEHRIKLSDCKPAHTPKGWNSITSLGFRAKGYGQPEVPADMVLVFDDFALHSPKDLQIASLADWMAKERVERMKTLKASGNPYYQTILDSVRNLTAAPEIKKDFTSCWEFAGMAGRALNAAWAAGSDDSPRKGDKVLIAYATAHIDYILSEQKEGTWFYSRKWTGGGDANTDRFTLGPTMDAIWWLRRLDGMEAAWQRWEKPLKAAVDFQYVHWGCYKERGFSDNKGWGSSAYTYPNQDVFHLFEMTLAHKWWGEPGYKESAEKTIAGLQAQLLPDGGFRYIGPETECTSYHNLNLVWLARYVNFTGDERVRKMIADTVEFYPSNMSNEGVPEFYTDCWWKHYWSDGAAAGPEIAAGVTGDGRNKWLANRILERNGAGNNYHTLYAGMFYRADVAEQPLPDNWLKFDRNIDGPRGRFGNWYFAGVVGGGARDTFVGAMVSEPGRAVPLNGALLAANIEAGIPGATGARDRRSMYISGPDDITATKIEGEVAALGARYTLRKPYINSRFNPDVPPTPWRATQVWLFTKVGLVGLVEVEVAEPQTVPHVQGELRFGPQMSLTKDNAGVYHCGAIAARILEHKFATVEHGGADAGYAKKDTPNEVIHLKTAGASFAAKPGEPLWYAAAISPEGAPAAADFQRLTVGDTRGLRVRIGGQTYSVTFDPAAKTVGIAAGQ